MATRQYVGARYVPKFYEGPNGTEWSNTVPYEALTIVTYLGNSYTSKKSVPVGVNITNSEYWVLTSIYNEQIERYRVELEESVASSRKNIIEGKSNIILVGDSWGAGGSASYHGWIYHFREMIKYNRLYSYSYGGAGFVATGTGVNNKSFLHILREIEADVDDNDSIDLIVVAGGVNDAGLNGVESAIETFVNYVEETFPNALVYIAICNRLIAGGINRYDYVTKYLNANGYHKITHVYNIIDSVSPNNYVDDLHLNNAGYKECAGAIIGGLIGAPTKQGYWRITFNAQNSEIGFNDACAFYGYNDNCQFYYPTKNFTGSLSKTGTIHKVEFNITDALVPVNTDIEYPIYIFANDGTGDKLIPAHLQFTANNKFEIHWIGDTNKTYTHIYFRSGVINLGSNH